MMIVLGVIYLAIIVGIFKLGIWGLKGIVEVFKKF